MVCGGRAVSRRALIVLALLLLSPSQSPAQWQTARFAAGENEALVEAATAGNATGHRIRVYLGEASQVRGLFTLPEGFDRLSPDTCPTYLVDDGPAFSTAAGTACRTGRWHADFAVAEIDDGRVHSFALDRLMKGRRLVFRYRIEGAGYRETEFTLRASRQAVQAVLGRDVRVTRRP